MKRKVVIDVNFKKLFSPEVIQAVKELDKDNKNTLSIILNVEDCDNVFKILGSSMFNDWKYLDELETREIANSTITEATPRFSREFEDKVFDMITEKKIDLKNIKDILFLAEAYYRAGSNLNNGYPVLSSVFSYYDELRVTGKVYPSGTIKLILHALSITMDYKQDFLDRLFSVHPLNCETFEEYILKIYNNEI